MADRVSHGNQNEIHSNVGDGTTAPAQASIIRISQAEAHTVVLEVLPKDNSSLLIRGRSVEDIKVREHLPPREWANAASAEIAKCTPWDIESIPRIVENQVWIKSNTFYKEALDGCKEQRKTFGAAIAALEKRKGEVTNEIYNLLGFFFVFQGVILTAVTQLTQTTSQQATRSLCGKVWFPLVLSALAAVAAFFGTSLKYLQLYSVKKDRHDQVQWLKGVERRETRLREDGENFLFKNVKTDQDPEPFKSYLILQSFAVNGLLVLVTVIFILSYFVIMCDKWVIESW